MPFSDGFESLREHLRAVDQLGRVGALKMRVVMGSNPSSPILEVRALYRMSYHLTGDIMKRRKYTDDEFRIAVESSKSWKEVHSKIGLKGTDSRTGKRLANRLQVSFSHFTAHPKKVSDETIAKSIKSSSSLRQAILKSGLSEAKYNYDRFNRLAREFEICLCYPKTKRRRSVRSVSDVELTDAVANSISIRQVCLKLGTSTSGNSHEALRAKIRKLGLNTGHFTGKAWLKGKSHRYNRRIPLDKILCQNSRYNRVSLKKRLLEANLLENKCYECGMPPIWNFKPLVLRLDHINGVSNDNRIENLRLICPACDSQSETYCGRNIKT